MVELFDVYEQYGVKGQNGVLESIFSKNRVQKNNEIIPEDKLQKIFSFDEANAEITRFTDLVTNGQYTLEQYFNEFPDNEPVLREYVTTTKTQEQSTQGLIEASKRARVAQLEHNEAIRKSTFAYKAGTVAAKAFAMAANMLVMMAVVKIISIAVEKFNDWTHAAENAAEASEKFAKAASDMRSSVSSNSKTLADLEERYHKLSEGVNELGENLSLSADEYDEYKGIIKQVSDIMPDLTTYFNAQGEAIGFVSGKLESLTGQYKNYVQQQAQRMLLQGDEEGNTFGDTLKNYDNNKRLDGSESFSNSFWHSATGVVGGKVSEKDLIKVLEEVSSKTESELDDYLNFSYDSTMEMVDNVQNNAFRKIEELTGMSLSEIKKLEGEDYNNFIESMKQYAETYSQGVATDMSEITSGLITVAYSKDSFWKAGEDARNDIVTFLSSLTSDVWDSLDIDTSDENAVKVWVEKIINEFSSNDEFAQAWTNLFKLDKENLPVKELVDQSNQIMDIIADALGLDEEGKKQFMISLGFDFDTAEGMKEGLKNKLRSRAPVAGAAALATASSNLAASRWVDTLTKKELEYANSDEFEKALEKRKKELNGAALTAEDYDQVLKQIMQDEVKLPTISTSESISALKNLEDSLSDLDAAMASLTKGEKVDLSNLDSIGQKFKEMAAAGKEVNLDNVNEALEGLANASSLDKAQNSLNSLCNEYVKASGILQQVNADNREVMTSRLESIGIINAEALVTQQLAMQEQYEALQKENAALETAQLVDATSEEISALADEQGQFDETEQEIVAYWMQKHNANNITIMTDADLMNLNNLMVGLGKASSALSYYIKMKSLAAGYQAKIDAGEDVSFYTTLLEHANENMQKITEQAQTDVNNALNSQVTAPIYGGGKNTQSAADKAGKAADKAGDAADKVSDAADKVENSFYAVFDWMERKIDALERQAEKAINRIKDSLQYATDRDFVSGTLSKINEQMKTNAYMVKRYNKSANDVGLDQQYKDLVNNGVSGKGDGDYSHIFDQELNDKITAYEDWRKKSIDAEKANEDLKESVKDLAETIANAPIDKMAEKIQKYEDSTELLEAKINNGTNYKNKNKLVGQKTKNVDKTLSAYKTAVDDDKSLMKKYSGKATGQKVSKKASKKDKDNYKKYMSKISAKTKAGQPIDDKTLEGVYSYCASVGSFSWYQNCVMYNASVNAYNSAKQTYDLYKETAKKEKAEAVVEKFENIQADYDAKRNIYAQRETQIKNAQSLALAKGFGDSANYYRQERKIAQKDLDTQKEELKKLEKTLKDGIISGSIKKGTDEYNDLITKINETSNSIDETKTKLAELDKQIRQIGWDRFDETMENKKTVTEETGFYINELSREDLTSDKDGGLTDNGMAVLGLRDVNYEIYIRAARDYANELQSIEAQLASNPYDKDLINRKKELIAAQHESVEAAQNEKYAMLDLMKQGYEAQKNALQDIIDKYKEMLNLQKDAYDYQKSISELVDSINKTQKQLSVFSGDTTEEARSKIQKLTVQLKEQKDSLQEKQYDKLVSDISSALDDLSDNFSSYLDEIVVDFEKLKELVNDNLPGIKSTLAALGTKIGTTVTESLDTALTENVETGTGNEYNNREAQSNGLHQNDDKQPTNNGQSAGEAAAKAAEEAKKAKEAADKAAQQQEKAKKKEQLIRFADLLRSSGVKRDTSKKISSYADLTQLLIGVTKKTWGKSDIIWDYARLHSLAEILGIPYDGDNSKKGSFYKGLTKLGITKDTDLNKFISKYAVGSKKIPYSQYAITQDGGQELVWHSADGGMLTRLNQGDKVFTNDMTNTMWDFAVDPYKFMKDITPSVTMPTMVTSGSSEVMLSIDNITMNGVNNPQEFVQNLKYAMKNDVSVKKEMQSITTDALSKGHNSLSKNKF